MPGLLYAGVGVSPENIEMVVAQGSQTKGIYNVVNDTAEPAHVKVDVEDWLKSRLGKVGIPVDQWLKVEPMEFDIGPKETKEVEYVITPPEGQEGELAAMVFFGTPSKDGGFSITSRFGVSIYAAIENTIRLGCNIRKVGVYRDVRSLKKGAGLSDRKVVFNIEVENSGNVHIRPTGTIGITGEKGYSDSVKIERGFPVYSEKSLSYGIPWNNTNVAPGKYEASILLDYGSLYKMDRKIEKKIPFTVNADGTVSY
jgi:P pilus assembly chaperone PapD